MHALIKTNIVSLLFTTCLLCCLPANSLDEQTKRLRGLRDSTVWIRSDGDEKIKIQWRDWYAGDSTINYIYLQSPKGNLIDKIKINYGDVKGEKQYQLSHEQGDYRIEFPGYFFRMGSLKVSKDTPMVIEPAKGHVSFHNFGLPLFFSVPDNRDRFALCGKYSNGPEKIQLYDPENNLQGELFLTQESSTLHFDCLKIEKAVSGNWSIRFSGTGKTAFWLDGIGNYFALNAGDLFIPVLKAGKAKLSTTQTETFPMGKIGSQLVNLYADSEIFSAIRYMNLNTFNHYIDHSWREPFNPDFPNGGDNDNPLLINWDGFNWDDQRIKYYRNNLNAQFSVIFDSRNSWLDTPLSLNQQKEYAEFVLAYITHSSELKNGNDLFFSLWDEPNLEKFTFKQYQSLLKTVAERLKSPENPDKVINAPLLAISSSGFDVTTAGKEYIGMHWAEKIYGSHDQLVDGIAFDYWNIRDLIELWRYGDAVAKARDIIINNDSDGNTDEAIIINQTSMSSGNSSSAYDVNTHFGALWLAGALCNAFNSGHLDAFHYFPTIDDKHHMKGLLYSDSLPTALPYSKKIKNYSIKRIGHSMAMFNRNILDKVIASKTDSLEVDALLTVDTDKQSITIIVVNKFPRTTELTIDLKLPDELLKKTYSMDIEHFGPEQERSTALKTSQVLKIKQHLLLKYSLAGETIYAFKLNHLDNPQIRKPIKSRATVFSPLGK